MRPSTEARFGVRALLGLQFVTSLAGVVLLGRTGPAVEQVLEENVVSTAAVEEMLEVLASDGDPARFGEALAKARANVTVPEEATLLRIVEAGAVPAMTGDVEARRRVAEALRDLGDVNRASMARSEAYASQLALAGAWAVALLGFLGFLVSLVVTRRIETRLIAPILEIDDVLTAARAGDVHRRCTRQPGGVGERLMANLDWLLDQHLAAPAVVREDPTLRAAVIGLLDRHAEPAVVGDRNGRVVAVNARVLDEGIGAAELAASVAEGLPPGGWDVTELGDSVWLATRSGA